MFTNQSTRTRRTTLLNRLGLDLEGLEPRLLLAGNVLAEVHGGKLYVTGDDLGNGIEIRSVGPQVFRIVGSEAEGAPTTVNGEDELVFAGVRGDVHIRAGNGNDRIVIHDAEFEDDLTLQAGSGQVKVELRDVVVRDDLFVLGSFALEEFRLERSHVGDDLGIWTSHNDDLVHLLDVAVGDDLSLSTQGGSDTLVAKNLDINDNALFFGGRGEDDFCVDSSTFLRQRIDLGDGDDRLSIHDTSTRKWVRLDGRKGVDELAVDASILAGRRKIWRFEEFTVASPCEVSLPDSSPIITVHDHVPLLPGTILPITSDMLSASDAGTSSEEIVFTLANHGLGDLRTGHVAFGDDPETPIIQFTQADLESGRLVFRDGVNDIHLPEIRVERFTVTATDADGNVSPPQGFLMLRSLPELTADDETIIWRPGDGNQFIDGGAGDDAFVLYGGDTAHQIDVRPSDDGQQIVVAAGSETVILDGIEDLYFLVGSGANELTIDGDFSQTDLSPNTIFVADNDSVDCNSDPFDPPDCSDLPDAYTVHVASDVIVHAGGGDNAIGVTALGIFVTAEAGRDFIRPTSYSGVTTFQAQLFPGGSMMSQSVPIAEAIRYIDNVTNLPLPAGDTGSENHIDNHFKGATHIHIDEVMPSQLVSFEFTGRANHRLYHVDVSRLNDGLRERHLTVDHLSHSVVLERSPVGPNFQGDRLFIVPQPNRSSYIIDEPPAPDLVPTVGAVIVPREIQIELNKFLMDSSVGANPIPAEAYQIKHPNVAVSGFERNAIFGEAGFVALETLQGGEVSDIIFAGDNEKLDDSLFFGIPASQGDRLFGHGGDDRLIGDRLSNVIDGGPGDDRIEGRRGNDTIPWSSGSDTIDGGLGLDVADYSTDPFPDDVLPARANLLDVSTDSDANYVVSYTADVIEFLFNIDSATPFDLGQLDAAIVPQRLRAVFDLEGRPLSGNATVEVLQAGQEWVLIDGEEWHLANAAGTLDVFGEGGRIATTFVDTLRSIEQIIGARTPDILRGHNGTDHFHGGPGNDRLEGNGGSDQLFGGTGDDDLFGDEDDDLLHGEAGADDILGGPGNDQLFGGLGSDTLFGDAGDDLLLGQFDDDEISGGPGDDTIGGGPGNDWIDGGPGLDVVQGGDGDDVGSFTLGEVDGANDRYDGGPGSDILRVVIQDQLGLSTEQISGLRQLQATFGTLPFQTFGQLQLRIENWETLEIVDPGGRPIDVLTLGNDPPTDLRLSNTTVEEGRPGAVIGLLVVDDPDNAIGDTHTFDVSDLRFEVRNGNELRLTTGTALDFETEPLVNLTVGATDLGGNRITRNFVVQVQDQVDTPFPPTDIVLSTAAGGLTVREETPRAPIALVGVIDPNVGQPHDFSFREIPLNGVPIVSTRFEVVDGVLRLAADSDGDGIPDDVTVDFETENSPIQLEITATDVDGLSITKTFAVAIIDVDENATPPMLPGSHLDVLAGAGVGSFLVTDALGRMDMRNAGDLTGDGLDDLVLTSMREIPQTGEGQPLAFLIPGGSLPGSHPTTGVPLAFNTIQPQSLTGTSFFLPTASLPNRSVSATGIGDFNGDGLNDLAIGVGKAETSHGNFEGGQVFVVLNRPGGLPNEQNRGGAFFDVDLTNPAVLDGTTTFRLEGTGVHERLGGIVSSVGDVDGDGFDDLLMSRGSAFQDAGVGALLLYGRADAWPVNLESHDLSGVRHTLIRTGWTTGIGDVNADGFDDLFAKREAEGEDGVILFGQANGLPTEINPADTHDVEILGGNHRFIISEPGVAGPAGDINSDGIEDFFVVPQVDIFSAPNSTNNELIVVFGRRNWPNTIALGDNTGNGLGGVSPIDTLGRGVQIVPGGDFGRLPNTPSYVLGVSGSGDVNGDGNDDLLLRVRRQDNGMPEHVIVFGSVFLPDVVVLNSANADPRVQLNAFEFPVSDGFQLDEGLAGFHDFNGDGFNEILIGDPAVPSGSNTFTALYQLQGGDLTGAVTQLGTAEDDVLLGDRLTNDSLVGGLGNDTLAGRGLRDVYRGGAGDDLLIASGFGIPEYVVIDGGSGFDTIRLAGDDLVFDLNTTGNSTSDPAGYHLVRNIEVIDLGLGGDSDSHTLIVDQRHLLQLPDSGTTIAIIGDSADTVTIHGSPLLDRREARTINGSLLDFDVYVFDGQPRFELLVGVGVRGV